MDGKKEYTAYIVGVVVALGVIFGLWSVEDQWVQALAALDIGLLGVAKRRAADKRSGVGPPDLSSRVSKKK